MLSRNALAVIVATALTAAVAGAQQPAKPATTTTRASTTAQAPAAAKKTPKTSSAVALPVSADSAKKIVASNAAGATVTSARLHRSAGKSYYNVSYKLKGDKKTMHATVDATSGAFATVAPAATKPAAKKP
jgi:uncharacterized membrane protein YkoI